ncbi:MAG: polysaccharide deacetylase family protein [Thermoanaerobaculales bacterium]|nr:polysaccharide deacetylase family protein [Thermoanaerobaculales bacterium]
MADPGTTSRCANHPSREAKHHCDACGKWLCDRCVQTHRGRVYCGFRCRLRGFAATGSTGFLSLLQTEVPTTWFVMCVGLAVLIAGSWITALVVKLSASEKTSLGVDASLPYAVAEMTREGGVLEAKIQGTPGASAVLLADGRPIRIVRLDSKGRATVSGDGIGDGARLEIAVFAEPPDAIEPLPTLTPTATPSSTPSSTPTATATATASSTATASPSRTPTSTATRSPRPTRQRETPTATRTVRPSRTPIPITVRATPKPSATVKPRDVRKPKTAPPILHLVTDAGPKIAITFDGNASSNGTTELLDTLQALDLKITLFVTGGFVERYPNLVRRAVLAGHEVGNHSYSHPHLTTYADNHRHDLLPDVTRARLHAQLRRTEEAFQKATGRPMAPLWRAPFGEENPTLRGWALELGYLHVRWSSLEGKSLDSLDWIADEHSKLYRDSQRMVDRLLSFPHLQGGIVLMHLSTEREEPPWSGLPRFVTELRRRGIEPAKISDMLRASTTWRPWYERAQRRHEETFGGD